MYKFIESGIRGGVSYIDCPHCKANNKYMKDYDRTKKTNYILYLDANNLYGKAMCYKLPVGDYKWEDANK